MMTRAILIHVVLLYCLNIIEIRATEDDSVCNKGQYGLECRYNCSSFCNFGKCRISHDKGVPECNAGCKKYHTGFFCQEFCPSMCLECNQTDGTCQKCIDGYYGMTCNQKCPRNCLNGTCHVIDGSCILKPYAGGHNTRRKRDNNEGPCLVMTGNGNRCCCPTGRRGHQCEQDCPNCQTFYVPNKTCENQCKTGYYGNACDKECPQNCYPGNSGKPLCEITSEGLRCMNGCYRGYTGFLCNDICSGNCKDICYQTDGKCVDCPNGTYGDMCNKNCSEGCKTHLCGIEDGSCQGGCRIGFYRNNCTGTCGVNCANSKCEDHVDGANPNTTFLCSEGCKNRYKGRSCDQECPKHCLICKQLSGECVDVFYLGNGTVQSSRFKPIPELAIIIITSAVTLIVTLAVTFVAVMCAQKRGTLPSLWLICKGARTDNSTREEELSLIGNRETMKQVPHSRIQESSGEELNATRVNNVELALIMGNNEIVELMPLMENTECNDQGKIRLIKACRTGKLEAVKSILRQNKELINVRGRHGMTPIMEAIGRGHTEVTDFLLQSGCDLSVVADNNNTVLHIACNRGNVQFVKDLLNKKLFDINSKGNLGRSPLMIAARNGNEALFDFLEREGADVNISDCNNDTILHVACFNRNEHFIEYLLNKNFIKINVKGCKGRTPVMLAAYNGYGGMFDLLWNYPWCEKSAKDDNNDTILHVACYNDNEEFVRHLLSLKVFDIECKGCKGRPPAMIAAQNGCRKVFELLVQEGCDLTVKDEKRHNILTLACCTDNKAFVKYLLALDKFDINTKGNKGRTPLLVAAKNGCRGVFNLLVVKGGDLTAEDDNGDCIPSLARGEFEKKLTTMNVFDEIIKA